MTRSGSAFVLVVDDHEAARFAKVEFLRRAGFQVVSASTGREAIQLAAEHNPDIVLLDVNLPDISGLEVCRILKRSTGVPAVQILQLSSTAITDADRVKGLEGGADAYLIEPVGREIVVATMEALLRVRQAERAMADAIRRERQAREDAERANRFKDVFLATLSHELRTPLNTMVGWVWHLRQSGSDAETRDRALGALERSIALQVRLVNDLLDVSRIERGKLELELTKVDLSVLVAAAIDSAGALAAQREVTFDVRSTPVFVLGDVARLGQIVSNLLSNAVQFSRRGGVVHVSVEIECADAVLRVRDEGAGIEPELLPHVFDAFRQGDVGPSRRHGGLGLGLAIVRQLVTLHQGSVVANSDGRDQGASLTVRLLRAETPPENASDASPEVADLAGARVLVVDDEYDSREWVASLIRYAGGKATVAASVTEALDVLTREPFDLILSDIGMPDRDGMDFIREVRLRSLSLPAVATTAYTSAAEQTQILLAGYDSFLAKPLDPAYLVAVLSPLLKRRR